MLKYQLIICLISELRSKQAAQYIVNVYSSLFTFYVCNSLRHIKKCVINLNYEILKLKVLISCLIV